MSGAPKQLSGKQAAGFTLVELLVATAITGVVVSLASAGLVALLNTKQRSLAESQRRIILNRALDYIADDIRESKTASTTPPTGITRPSGSVLFLTKPDDTVVIYSIRPSGVWRKPEAIYRKEGDQDSRALVDAIASTSPTCSSNGGTASTSTKGFKVFVHDRQVKVCLLGQLPNAATLPLETQVSLRSAAP